ncbi:MAG: sigma 54-interacting transcriptional regulator [Rhodocyclaceae bacterium]
MPAWCGSTNVTRHASASLMHARRSARDRGDHSDLADARGGAHRPAVAARHPRCQRRILRRHAHPDQGRRRRDDGDCHRLCALRQAAAAAALHARLHKLRHQLAQTQQHLAAERRAKYTFTAYIGNGFRRPSRSNSRRAAQHGSTPPCCCSAKPAPAEFCSHTPSTPPRRAPSHPFVGFNVAIPCLLEARCFGLPRRLHGRRPEGPHRQVRTGQRQRLFLDEIGDMPLTLQAKLLRVLQEHEVEPLGSNKVVEISTCASSPRLRAITRPMSPPAVSVPTSPGSTCSPAWCRRCANTEDFGRS